MTDWDVFFENEENVDTISDSISSYVLFCQENVIPKKVIKVYSNSKPWVSSELKKIFSEKKRAFLAGDKQKEKELEKEFRWKNKKSCREYRDKVQAKLTEGNGRGAWDGLNTMMGRKVQKKGIVCDDPTTFSNDLNNFYGRFDVQDFSNEVENVCQPLISVPNDISVDDKDVKKVFAHVNPRKAAGPNGVGVKF